MNDTQMENPNPTTTQVRQCFELGKSFQQQGDLDQAIGYYQQAIALDPRKPNPHRALGDIFFKQHRWSEATLQYRQALVANPNDAWNHHRLGQALYAQNLFPEAAIAFLSAIRIKPEVRAFQTALSKSLEVSEKPEEFVGIQQQLLDSGSSNFRLYYSIGQALSKRGSWDEAILCFLEALKRKPNYPALYKAIAQVLEQQGHASPTEIKQCYNRIIPRRILTQKLSLNERKQIAPLETDHNVTLTEIYPPAEFKISLQTIAPWDQVSFPQELSTREGFVVTLNQGRGWSDGLNTAIITHEGKLLRSKVSSRNSELAFLASQLHSPLELEGSVAFFHKTKEVAKTTIIGYSTPLSGSICCSSAISTWLRSINLFSNAFRPHLTDRLWK
jgi:cytochrome c-type biogenesis protein CcmH/NrfG